MRSRSCLISHRFSSLCFPIFLSLACFAEERKLVLALERESITLSTLQEDIIHFMPKGELQEAVSSLQRRQLIETSAAGVTLHTVIMEYMNDRLVNQVCDEIKMERL